MQKSYPALHIVTSGVRSQMQGRVYIQEATRATRCVSRLTEDLVTVSVHVEGASGKATPTPAVSSQKTRKGASSTSQMRPAGPASPETSTRRGPTPGTAASGHWRSWWRRGKKRGRGHAQPTPTPAPADKPPGAAFQEAASTDTGTSLPRPRAPGPVHTCAGKPLQARHDPLATPAPRRRRLPLSPCCRAGVLGGCGRVGWAAKVALCSRE